MKSSGHICGKHSLKPRRSLRLREKGLSNCATGSSRRCAGWGSGGTCTRRRSGGIVPSGRPGRAFGWSRRTAGTSFPGSKSSGSRSRPTGGIPRESRGSSTSWRGQGSWGRCGGPVPSRATRSGSARWCSTSSEVDLKIGIFGGTFDPVHQGHMIVAEQVMTELDLAQVVFVPGGIPPHKEASSVRATAEDRLAMVEAAVEGNERFTVDRVEIDAGRAMHSVETVGILRERSPDDEWFFITGADEVSNLLAWREPDSLLEKVVMVAATRPGYDLSKLDHLEAVLRNFDRIFPIECTRVDISATAIRRRMLQGKSVRYLVPEGVYEIMRDRRLYEGDARQRAREGRLKEETL